MINIFVQLATVMTVLSIFSIKSTSGKPGSSPGFGPDGGTHSSSSAVVNPGFGPQVGNSSSPGATISPTNLVPAGNHPGFGPGSASSNGTQVPGLGQIKNRKWTHLT